MKILLLGNQDIASLLACNRLINALPYHDVTLWTSARVGKGKQPPPELAQLDLLERQVLPELLLPFARQHGCRIRPFEQLVSAGQFQQISSINDEATLRQIEQIAPDLILSIRFGLILREPVIQLSRLGVLNLHSGILPDYRGVMATFHAMLNTEQQIGTTLHFIQDAGIDSGDIVSIQRQPLDYRQSYLTNVLSLYNSGVDAMVSAVESLNLGKPLQSASPSDGGNYFSHPDQAQLDAFISKGLRLFDMQELQTLVRSWIAGDA